MTTNIYEVEEAEKLKAEKLEAEKRALFYEEAARPCVGCRNPKVAWVVMRSGNFFTGNGSPDWAAIRKAVPEIFMIRR